MFGVVVSALAADATFPGGKQALDKYIADNLKYPSESKDNGIEGIVDVSFTVKADGTIGSIKILRMIDPGLETEAIRLVKTMPKWTPATKDGAPVDSKVTVAIPFTLSE